MTNEHTNSTHKMFDNLTVEQFCAELGISKSTYFRLKNSGRGPKEMIIGRRVFLPRHLVQEWLESLITQPKKEADDHD